MKTIDAILFKPSAYDLADLADEIRVDGLCHELLKHFHQQLLQDNEPLAAGSMAAGADYFLRDFMIDHQRANIFDLSAQRVRSFAGNWYIVNTLEPNIAELESLLSGVAQFCQFCAEHQLTAPEQAQQAAATCRDIDYYRERIDSFYAIVDNGFSAWNTSCPSI
jgi:hypothetical protein